MASRELMAKISLSTAPGALAWSDSTHTHTDLRSTAVRTLTSQPRDIGFDSRGRMETNGHSLSFHP